MSLVTIFWTALVAGLTGAMMPGPMLSVTINASARRGFMAGPMVVLGHAILELALIIGLLLGLNRFLTRPPVGMVIGIAGGAVLIWMGYGIVKGVITRQVSLELEAASENRQPGPTTAGIITSLSNPYWILWWATVGLTFLKESLALGKTGVVSFYLGHISADLVWYSLIAFAVAASRRFMNDTVYRGILLVCGVFLVGLGGWFIYSSAT